MRKLITLMFLVFIFVSMDITAQELSYSKEKAEKEFKNKYGSGWVIQWNKKTNIPERIWNAKTLPQKNEPVKIAKEFLKDISSLFGKEKINDLEFDRVLEVENNYHVRFKQTVKGVPILDTYYLVHINKNGQIDMANGNYYPNVKLKNNAILSYEETLVIAEDHFECQPNYKRNPESRLVVYTINEEFVYAWELRLSLKSPNLGLYKSYIDAETGEVYEFENADRQATGNVYSTHPGLNSNTSSVTLNRLDGTHVLRGTYADVAPYSGSRAYDVNDNFTYNPSLDSEFDEVNVYYHIDKIRYNYYRNLGFSGFNQINVSVHDGEYKCTALFQESSNPSNYYLIFGDGAFCNEPNNAWENKIIYHEYTHAISYYIFEVVKTNSQGGAISESLSDYFSASFTNRPVILDYVAPNNTRDMRESYYSNYSNIPDPISNKYYASELFSFILWNIRNDNLISVNTADRLVFKAMYRISTSNPTFLQFRDAMIAYDRSSSSGTFTNMIIQKFVDKGVAGAVDLYAEIIGPESLQKGSTGIFTVIPSGGSRNYTNYQWWKKTGSTWSYLSSSARQTQITNSSTIDFQLKCKVTDSAGDYYEYIHSIDIVDNPDKNRNQKTKTQNLNQRLQLKDNFPNPYNSDTKIEYIIPEDGLVSLSIIDIRGNIVAEPVKKHQQSGLHSIHFSDNNLESGLYFYILKYDNQKICKKMLLIK